MYKTYIYTVLFFITIISKASSLEPPDDLYDIYHNEISHDKKGLIILIHGWNPDGYANPYTEDGNSLAYWEQLDNKVFAYMPGYWEVGAYFWPDDANTGYIVPGYFKTSSVEKAELLIDNAALAAERADAHGYYLSNIICNKYPNLESVHIIAHSAGSWMARSTAIRLSSKYNVQITLLDPFIVGWPSAYNNEAMNDVSNYASQSENYFYIDPTDVYFSCTSNHFIDFDISEKVGELKTSLDGHSKPIEWYANTISNNPPIEFGWVNSFAYKDSKDKTKPTVTINYPASNPFYSGTAEYVTIRGNATDSGCGIKRVYGRINNGNSSIQERVTSWEYTVHLNVGTNNFEIWAEDFEGNTSNIKSVQLNRQNELVAIEINGPDEVQKNSTYNYTCIAYYYDADEKDITQDAKWSVNVSSTYASIGSYTGVLTTKSLSSNKTCRITASFEGETDYIDVEVVDVPKYTLSINANNSNWGTTSPATGTHSYDSGEVVNITAIPASGYRFEYWSGNVADQYLPNTTIKMDGDKTVTAFFALKSNASIALDTDLSHVGYQSQNNPIGIGPDQNVGFAVYIKNVGLNVFVADFKWDGTKATFSSDSRTSMNQRNLMINGRSITLAAEGNILGQSLQTIGEVREEGHYQNTYTVLGSSVSASDTYRLLYFLVLKTKNNFNINDSFDINCNIQTANAGVTESSQDIIFTVNEIVPEITLISPQGGDSLVAGSAYDIKWTSSNINDLNLEYSTKNGPPWQIIKSNVNASSGKYPWAIPSNISSTNCIIRATDSSLPLISNQSGLFSITIPPQMQSFLSVFQNPGLHSYLHFAVNATACDEVSLKVNNSPVTLNQIAAGSWYGTQTITTIGNCNLSLTTCGELLERQYSIGAAKIVGSSASSYNNNVTVIFEPYSVNDDIYFAIFDNNSKPSLDEGVYEIGTESISLYHPAKISIRSDDRNKSIYRRNGQEWMELPSQYNNALLVAETEILGEFKLGEKTDIPIIYETRIIGNYPNPFNSETKIEFNIGPEYNGAVVKLSVYNINGQLINTLKQEPLSAGLHQAIWDGLDANGVSVSSGVYFYQMIIDGVLYSGDMLFVK